MIRAVHVYIAPDCPTGRYSVEEEYPSMRTLYTGDDFDKVVEAIRMDNAETASAERTEKARCMRSTR